MEKIDKDYKRRNRKILGKLSKPFNRDCAPLSSDDSTGFWVPAVKEGNVKFPVTTESHPRPRVTKLSPDDSVDWIIVSKPILTAAVNDAAFHAFQNIPGKQQTGFAALVKNST